MDSRIDEQFSLLLHEAASTLTSDELDEIRHFLRVNEYGLALETMLDIFREERKVLSSEVQSRLEGVATLMGIHPKIVRKRLES